MKLFARIALSRVGLVLMVCLVIVCMHPGLGYRALYAVLFGGKPPASSWYRLHVQNDSNKTLVITLISLTDRVSSATSPWTKFQRVLAGWTPEAEVVLAPGNSGTLSVPSEVDERTAVFLLSARTDQGFSKIVDQSLFTKFFTPQDDGPLVNTRSSRNSSTPATLTITQSDLKPIDVEDNRAVALVERLNAVAP